MRSEHVACQVGMLARAMAHRAAIGIDAEDLGISRRQPARRCCRRRAHNGLYTGSAEHLDRAVEQIEVERPLAWLENVPRKFAKTRRVEPRCRHALGIALPITLIDMLGIMRRPDE